MDDSEIRSAAFAYCRHLMATRPHLTSGDLKAGFTFDGERIPWVNPQQGIFKPRQMQHLLSITTVHPAKGRKVWYDDQREVHKQIFSGSDVVEYAFMGKDPESHQNRWLKEAWKARTPVIYFLGIAPGLYLPVFPVFIAEWQPARLRVQVAFSLEQQIAPAAALTTMESSIERRYALREVKQRLHQATFREAVIEAYGGRCALSGLPEPLLIDAAHIVSDKNERLGQPVVPNGLPLSKIHHAAFDSHLIGIDPDYRIHVSERLLEQRDGPMLEALKQLHLRPLLLPKREKDCPDRERLELRFAQFKSAA